VEEEGCVREGGTNNETMNALGGGKGGRDDVKVVHGDTKRGPMKIDRGKASYGKKRAFKEGEKTKSSRTG